MSRQTKKTKAKAQSYTHPTVSAVQSSAQPRPASRHQGMANEYNAFAFIKRDLLWSSMTALAILVIMLVVYFVMR